MNRYLAALALTSSTLGLMAPLSAAHAQESPAEAADATGGEIVVTAQKRDERLLDVPVAVSAVSSDSLVSQNLVQLSDFASRVPGLAYGGERTFNLAIRGVTTGGSGGNPTIALLIDDVQFGSSSFLGQPPIPDFDPATLERVEVLRGPQGTLYGASSLGGLIKYVTKSPDLKDYGANVEFGSSWVEGGTSGYAARGSVNLPVVTDRVALNVSGFYRDDPRYIDNVYPGTLPTDPKVRDVNKRSVYGGRAALRLKLSDDLTVDLSAIAQHRNQEQGTAMRAVSDTDLTPRYGDLTLRSSDSLSNGDFRMYTGRVNYTLGNINITSISAWGQSKSAVDSDVTDTFGGLLRSLYTSAPSNATSRLVNADKTQKFSEELRIGATGAQADWLVGLFYTKEHSQIDQTLTLNAPTGGVLATPVFGSGPFIYTEKAVFADLTYHVTPQFDIQLGGRYANNKQDYTSVSVIDATSAPVFGASGTTNLKLDQNAFTWLISPSYHLSRDSMVYARVATGYRPGGPNNTGLPNIPSSFSPDRVTNYELGFKTMMLDRKVSLDASVFQIDWKNIQLQAAAPNQFSFFANGGKARSRGAEISTRIAPGGGITIDANASYTDAVLAENLPAPIAGGTALVGLKGDRLPTSPRFAFNLSVQEDFQLTDTLAGFVGASVNHVGDRYSDFITSNNVTAGRKRIYLPAYTQVDLRAGISIDKGWKLNAFVRNLFNERGVLFATNRSGASPASLTNIQPRTFGFTVSGKI